MSVMKYPITTMEQVRAERKRDLTEEEQKVWYSKYHYREMGRISDENLAALNKGPCAPELLLPAEKRSNLLLPGEQAVETGWGLLPDGSGLACTRVYFPGATPDMLSWWYTWHALEDLRYDIWCPPCHTKIWMEHPERNLDSSNVPIKSRNYRAIHHPFESGSLDTVDEITIKFFSPEDFGLDPIKTALSTSECIQCLCCYAYGDRISALFGDLKKPDKYADDDLVPFNAVIHAVRPVEGGCELRSRYWVGKTLINGQLVNELLPGFDYEKAAWICCRHSLLEYSNLATFLPELYNAMEGKVER